MAPIRANHYRKLPFRTKAKARRERSGKKITTGIARAGEATLREIISSIVYSIVSCVRDSYRLETFEVSILPARLLFATIFN